MKKRSVILTITLTLLAGFAVAGLVQPAPVDVDLVNMFAQGDQHTARTSAGDTEFIGCGTRSFDDGMGNTFRFGFCQAEDADGDNITCFTQSDALLDEMREQRLRVHYLQLARRWFRRCRVHSCWFFHPVLLSSGYPGGRFRESYSHIPDWQGRRTQQHGGQHVSGERLTSLEND